MSSPAKSSFWYGILIVILGIGFALAPNALLPLLTIETSTEPWVRLLGVVVVATGAFYILAARTEHLPFFRLSIYERAAVALAVAGFVVLGYAPAPLLLFVAMELAGAAWTLFSLRRASSGRAVPQ